MVLGKRDDEIAIRGARTIGWQQQPTIWHASEGGDRELDIGDGLDPIRHQLERKGCSGKGGSPQEIVIVGCFGVCHESNTFKVRRYLLKHRQPFASDAWLVRQKARDIAA